jgi:16S rRNA (adenine(1408)-N(1))-methyltransferase
LDLGTGDGRLPFTWAREAPERLFIGIDANAAGVRELSGRAAGARLTNLAYVRAGIEALPAALHGIADRVTVVLPWGSLLAGVARPSTPALGQLRGACQRGARLTVVLGSEASRDAAEIRRLGLPPLVADGLAQRLGAGYAEAGFAITRVRRLEASELDRWPSSWARRLAFDAQREFVELRARAL